MKLISRRTQWFKAIYLFFGLSSFLFLASHVSANVPLHKFYTLNSQGYHTQITGMGDVNQDGKEDYLTGQTGSGAAYIVSGADGSVIQSFAGQTEDEGFCFSVANAGDLNQDGINDLLVSSYGGNLYAYSPVDGTLLYITERPSSNVVGDFDFGLAIISLGDKDGDDIPDFVVSAPEAYQGVSVYFFSGANGQSIGVLSEEYVEWLGFNFAVADVSEYNDGLELFITARNQKDGGLENNGMIFMVEWDDIGAPDVHSRLMVEGQTSQQGLGFSITMLDDVSGDGKKDLAALDRSGQVHIYSFNQENGQLDLLNTFSLAPLSEYETSYPEGMMSLSSAGDFNGDGFGDFIIGRTTGLDQTGYPNGIVQIYSGADGTVLKNISGPPTAYMFGSCVAVDTDVNGDGIKDILVGIDDYHNPQTDDRSGAVFAYSGVWTGVLPQDDTDWDGMPDAWETEHGLDPSNPDDAAQDPDEDELNNFNEFVYGTDPQDADSDQDGMQDGCEVKYSFNPMNPDDWIEDADNDGLPNYEECNLNTDPHNPDSDGDTLPDGWEWSHGMLPFDSGDVELDNDGDSLTNLAEYMAGTQPDNPDTDNDGLSDGDEISIGTDPLLSDSDSDGIPDGWEKQHDLDPTDSIDATGDLDDDGLNNLSEFQYGSDPSGSDTDNDSLSDGSEVNVYQTDPVNGDTDGDQLIDGSEVLTYHTNPLETDTDDDRLADGAEVITYQTNPIDSDTDDDGMPDGWEVGHTLNPNDPTDATLDSDNDGATNLDEWLARTDPHDSAYYPGGPGALKWVFTAGDRVSTVSIGQDGTLYCVSTDGYLYALNPNGSQKWTFPMQTATYTVPVIGEDGTIYVSARLGNSPQIVYCINPDGTLRWRTDSIGSNYVSFSPAIAADGTIYVPAGPKIVALNPDGTEKWTAPTNGLGTSSPAIATDGTIYVKSWEDYIYAINPDGSEKWKISLSGRARSPHAAPAIGFDGTIYVCDNNNRIHAINPDGTKKWVSSTGNSSSSLPVAIAMDGTIYVAGENFIAFNPDGSTKWEVDMLGNSFSAPAVAEDGTIFVIGSAIYAFNPDGIMQWYHEPEEPVYLKSAAILSSDNTLYVGSWKRDKSLGSLFAIHTDNGGPADSAWPMAGHDSRQTGNVSTKTSNTAPTSIIVSPGVNLFFFEDDAITFSGVAEDLEQGDLSNLITWQSDIDGALGSGAEVKVQLSVGVHTIRAHVTDQGGLEGEDTITVTVITPKEDAPPVEFDFDTGMPAAADGWQFYSSNTGYGRIQVIDGRLRMDVNTNGNFSLNEAIFTVDLSDASQVVLSFFQSDQNDEAHAMPQAFSGHVNADGVAVSNDGIHWYSALPSSTLEVSTSGQNYTIDLDAVVSEIQTNFDPSFQYNKTFQIKFQQYDNYTFPTDGREWDNIQIKATRSALMVTPLKPLEIKVKQSDMDAQSCQSYQLGNVAQSGLSWWATPKTDRLSVSVSSGALVAGEKAAVDVCWDISGLVPGDTLTGQVSFVDTLNGANQVRSINVMVVTDGFSPPYNQDFSNGLPDMLSGWDYYASNPSLSRIEVTDGRMRMDVNNSGTFNLNEAILTLDLSGQSNLELSFFQAESSDESHAMPAFFTGHSNSDGVAISANGETWYRIVDSPALDVGITGDVFTIDLDAHVARIQVDYDPDFGYGTDFKIKFQQYDNYTFTSDGREWDDITVMAKP